MTRVDVGFFVPRPHWHTSSWASDPRGAFSQDEIPPGSHSVQMCVAARVSTGFAVLATGCAHHGVVSPQCSL